MNQKGISSIVIILIVVGIFVVVGGGYWYFVQNRPVVCTQETKQCPDGSAVGRTGPNCEFAECPSANSSASLDVAMNRLTYRVEKYYKAIVSNNYNISYETELQFVRDGITKDDYIRTAQEKPVTIESFSLGEITIKGTSAGVDISIDAIHEGRKINSTFKDIWVFENGDWYHAPN